MIRSRLLFACSLGFGILAAGTAFAQQEAITSKDVNLRAGPSRDYPVVAGIPEGSSVQVVGCQENYAWCDVITGPDRGWLYSGNLEYPYEGQTVPIIQEGPAIGLPIVTFSVGPYWDNYYRGRPWYTRRSYFTARPVPQPRAWVRPTRSVSVQSSGRTTYQGTRTGSRQTVARPQPDARQRDASHGQHHVEQRPQNRTQAQQPHQPAQPQQPNREHQQQKPSQPHQAQAPHQRPQEAHSGHDKEDKKH